jgi:hypothetical protein
LTTALIAVEEVQESCCGCARKEPGLADDVEKLRNEL